MNKIKFRAYNKIEGYFTWNIGIQQYSNGEVKLWENCITKEILDDKNFILQQFTGLLDKYGREIYEGDITETIIGTEYQNAGKYIGEVKFDNGRFYIDNDFGKFYCGDKISLFPHFDGCVVIGDIFENPELIEEKVDTKRPFTPVLTPIIK